MLAGTDDHLTWLSPVILNLENMGLTHLESEIRVFIANLVLSFLIKLLGFCLYLNITVFFSGQNLHIPFYASRIYL